MKKLLLAMASLGLMQVLAGTYTWTGAAGDGLYYTAGNWDYDGAAATTSPGGSPSEDIVISGAVTVTYVPVPGSDFVTQAGTTMTVSDGATFVQEGDAWPFFHGNLVIDNATVDFTSAGRFRYDGSVTLRNGGKALGTLTRSGDGLLVIGKGCSYAVSGNLTSTTLGGYVLDGGLITVSSEFRPADGTVFTNPGTFQVKLFAPQTSGSVITFNGPNLICEGSGYDGFYQTGATCINVPAGSPSKFTIKSAPADVYAKTFGTSTTAPKYKYDGNIISVDQFKMFFTVEEHAGLVNGETGYSDFYLTPEKSVRFVSASAMASGGDTTVFVRALVDTTSTEVSAVLAWGETDAGKDLQDWAHTAQGSFFDGVVTGAFETGLSAGDFAYVRVFITDAATGDEARTDAIRVLLRDYGVEGVVNEWTGAASASLSEDGNWKLGHVPTADEIRWFETGRVETTGNFTCRATDVFKGTDFVIGGEFQPVDGLVFEGGDFTFTLFAPQQSAIFTCKGGSFTASSTGNDGFWAPGTTYCNISSGSTAVFTFPFAKDKMSGTIGKFRYNGAKITDFDDASVWTVVENTDVEPVTTTFYLTPAAEGAPVLGEVSASVDAESPTTVTVVATLAKVGESQPTAFKVMYGLSVEQMTTSADFTYDGEYADDTVVSLTLTGLEAKRKYYYQIVAANASGTVSSDVASFVTFHLGDAVCAWVGKNGSLASNDANWSTGKAPTATTDVYIYDVYAENMSITWDIPTVASWHQESFAGGSVEVVFASTKDAPVTISGDAEILSGIWRQGSPADVPTKCLNVAVGGDLTIAADAKITAGRTGYHAGPGASVNYGTIMEGEETERQLWTGGSYAGDAGHPTYTGSFVSYGSILNPLDWGSAGKGDNVDTYSGAGLVILTVGGVLTVDGSIDADGFGYNLDDFAGSSGGTVNVTAGTIAGSGRITANGGSCNCGPGGGGRIRVALTAEGASFDGFSAPAQIIANSGTLVTTSPMTTIRDTTIGAAGTVTLVAGGEAKVVVADTCATRRTPTTETLVSATHLPASANPTEDLKESRWELLDYGKIRLTADVKVAALTVTDTAKQKVFLDGHTLRVSALTVGAQRLRGMHTAASLNALLGAEVFEGEGSVFCGGPGFAIIIR